MNKIKVQKLPCRIIRLFDYIPSSQVNNMVLCNGILFVTCGKYLVEIKTGERKTCICLLNLLKIIFFTPCSDHMTLKGTKISQVKQKSLNHVAVIKHDIIASTFDSCILQIWNENSAFPFFKYDAAQLHSVIFILFLNCHVY